MVIYRAMCTEELTKTKLYKRPHFIKRYKWFTSNLDFIINRVLDGKFNNSNYDNSKYQHICSFEWDGENSDWINVNEIQFDRRKNLNIIFKEEVFIIERVKE